MKTIIAALLLASTSAFAASTPVDGAPGRDGAFLQRNYGTTPDSSLTNNWSTQGNINPPTGRSGTVNPNAFPPPPFSIGPSTAPSSQTYER